MTSITYAWIHIDTIPPMHTYTHTHIHTCTHAHKPSPLCNEFVHVIHISKNTQNNKDWHLKTKVPWYNLAIKTLKLLHMEHLWTVHTDASRPCEVSSARWSPHLYTLGETRPVRALHLIMHPHSSFLPLVWDMLGQAFSVKEGFALHFVQTLMSSPPQNYNRFWRDFMDPSLSFFACHTAHKHWLLRWPASRICHATTNVNTSVNAH